MTLTELKDKLNNDETFKKQFTSLSDKDKRAFIMRADMEQQRLPNLKNAQSASVSMVNLLVNPFMQSGNTEAMVTLGKEPSKFRKYVDKIGIINPIFKKNKFDTYADLSKGALVGSISMISAFGSAIESEALSMSTAELPKESAARLGIWSTNASIHEKIRHTLPYITQRPLIQTAYNKIIGKYTNIDDMVASSGKFIRDLANTALEFKPYQPKNKLIGDIGAGSSSLFAAIGLTQLTKNPVFASSLFSAVTKGQVWNELRKRDWEEQEALAVSDIASIITFTSEMIGLDFLMNKINGSNEIYVGSVSAISEALQEFIENEGIGMLQYSVGGTDKSIKEITKESLYSGFIALFSGFGYGAYHSIMTTHTMQDKLADIGVPRNKINDVVKRLFDANKNIRNKALEDILQHTINKWQKNKEYEVMDYVYSMKGELNPSDVSTLNKEAFTEQFKAVKEKIFDDFINNKSSLEKTKQNLLEYVQKFIPKQIQNEIITEINNFKSVENTPGKLSNIFNSDTFLRL